MDNQSAPAPVDPATPIAPATTQPQYAPTPHVPDPVTPLAGNMLPQPKGKLNVNPILYVLIAILSVGTLGFGVFSASLYNTAQTATNTLNSQKANAATAAKTEQKKADDEANRIANELPFRSYTAPVADGAFEIKFPKNWSSYVVEETSGTQVSLVLNPDFIRRSNSADELVAARVTLQIRLADQYMNAFASDIKRGTVKKTDTTISGLRGFDLTGTFQDKKSARQVVVPVRDKIIVFVNENPKYAQEFSQILAQAKINP